MEKIKKLVINIPEGYEIDKEQSTFAEIIFKKIESKLPMSWEELGNIEGCYIRNDSQISDISTYQTNAPSNRNIIPTEYAEAVLALIQLLQLRKAWIGDWQPNWDGRDINCVLTRCDKITTDGLATINKVLSFPTDEMCSDFIAAPEINKLLQIAKPLL